MLSLTALPLVQAAAAVATAPSAKAKQNPHTIPAWVITLLNRARLQAHAAALVADGYCVAQKEEEDTLSLPEKSRVSTI